MAQQNSTDKPEVDIEEVSRQCEDMMMSYLTGEAVGRETVGATA